MKPSHVLWVGVVLTLGGCPRPPGIDRSRWLLGAAAREAGLVEVPKERLQRLLNLAYRQNLRGYSTDARATLATARSTLLAAGADHLAEHPRLAAWVSISQLSRGAGDLAAARSACGEAVRFLQRLEPLHRRSDYVRGVATELRALYGPQVAAALLREAAAWAMRIEPLPSRRVALSAIAWDLFLCDDYPGGLAALRRDGDPAWRADTLASLGAGPGEYRRFRFGKELSFEGYYHRQ